MSPGAPLARIDSNPGISTENDGSGLPVAKIENGAPLVVA